METNRSKKRLLQFFGLTLFTQAVTSLVGGTIFMLKFDTNELTEATLTSISKSTATAYSSVLLQIVTGMVIIMLGSAMYQASIHINKTMAVTALSLYVVEAVLLVVSQVFIFGLVEVSQQYVLSLDTNYVVMGQLLFALREFTGKIAMIPFGVGAAMFYYLLWKAEVFPKWLAFWGMFTVQLILVCVPLMAFGVEVPLWLLLPYVPFEFVAGIYIMMKYREKNLVIIEQ